MRTVEDDHAYVTFAAHELTVLLAPRKTSTENGVTS
jgi:hypothetical protein